MKQSILRAALSCLLIFSMLLTGCGAASTPQETVSSEVAVALPAYPQMSPYPSQNQSMTLQEKDSDTSETNPVNSYDAWREDMMAQRNQPDGYADGLIPFFQKGIPAFLTTGQTNPVCSPLNLYMALALLAETSSGTSRQQILDALNAESTEVVRLQAGQVWNAHYCNDNANTCILANSLWLNQGLTVNQTTADTLAQSYYASVFQGDLGSEEMNQAFRNWLNEQTGGLLEGQIQNLQMDPQTILALATTIFYQAKWSAEFSEEKNTESSFHAPSGDRIVTFLNQQLGYGPYFWGEDFGAVYLALEDGSSMWLILPDEGKTPQDLLDSGLALDMILNHGYDYENKTAVKVNLSMPKFDITSDARMEGALKSLGITQIFDPQNADFSAILPESTACLDQIQHTARVTVDEEGVSAAAYTAMMLAGAARPPQDEIDFILDRPFLFVISSHDNLPLFAGIVNEP